MAFGFGFLVLASSWFGFSGSCPLGVLWFFVFWFCFWVVVFLGLFFFFCFFFFSPFATNNKLVRAGGVGSLPIGADTLSICSLGVRVRPMAVKKTGGFFGNLLKCLERSLQKSPLVLCLLAERRMQHNSCFQGACVCVCLFVCLSRRWGPEHLHIVSGQRRHDVKMV